MDKIVLLHTVPIFRDLSDKDVIAISDKMVSRSYSQGQMILLEEAMGETFFVIAGGSVKITRLSEDGREVILAMLGEGDFFGEMSLLDGGGRSANVVALEEAEVLTLARKFPKIAISFLEELALRLRKSNQQIESLSLSDVEHRIGMTLVRLSEELGKIKNGNVNIYNLPYQQDIANMAGTSRETVSRVYKMLEDKQYISRAGKTLKIINFSTFIRQFT